jgi:DNA-binding Lrp family transcriptional regulator
MTEPQSAAEGPVWTAPRVREIARLSLDFVLDVSRISRGAGDLLDPLLLTAILDANQAALHRDPELARRYGDAGAALPNEHRRPISVNALAKSLRLPFESVRRRVGGWVAAGVCVRTPAGVYVPAEVVTSPAYTQTQAARVARLAAFHAELVRAGFITPARADPAPQWAVRAADRALAQYMLRTCDELIALTASPVTGFVLLGLGAAGIDPGRARRRPQPVAAISPRVGMPAETVRRHLLALERLGLARHAGKAGWTSAAAPDTWPRLARLAERNEANLRRLFERLAELRAECPACA